MADRSELDFYSDHFDTVEINNSFYQLPEREAFEQWREQSPENFLFAVKASRYLTHMKKLKAPEEPLKRLMDNATGLGPKLGPLLYQFPKQWTMKLDRLTGFLEVLKNYPGQRHAMEFRHKSWLVPDVYRLLETAGVALCLPVGMGLPVDPHLTTDWTYIRMHHGKTGMGYGRKELTEWADRIRRFRRQGAETVYVYFNNDIGGHAPRDAYRLRAMLAE
ncbi:MAG: hypothetical protein QOE92_1931 [Chloroflexota bacterium]|jgi:uncharacterized protein YecE (DUF72 family)|nr:hypothetical protein [Chloroflexota bacterium]